MSQDMQIVPREGRKARKIDTLPADIRKHHEDSMRHNYNLMRRLAEL